MNHDITVWYTILFLHFISPVLVQTWWSLKSLLLRQFAITEHNFISPNYGVSVNLHSIICSKHYFKISTNLQLNFLTTSTSFVLILYFIVIETITVKVK